MTTFAGVVTLEEDLVPVTIGIDDDEVTLVSGRVEIGKWPANDCTFVQNGDGSWVIEAEDDSVAFLPDDPGRFAKGLAGHMLVDTDASGIETSPVQDDSESMALFSDGPAPNALTVVGFYALAALTLAMGVWAFINVVL